MQLRKPQLCAVLLSRVLKARLVGDLVFSIFSKLKDTRPVFKTLWVEFKDSHSFAFFISKTVCVCVWVLQNVLTDECKKKKKKTVEGPLRCVEEVSCSQKSEVVFSLKVWTQYEAALLNYTLIISSISFLFCIYCKLDIVFMGSSLQVHIKCT